MTNLQAVVGVTKQIGRRTTDLSSSKQRIWICSEFPPDFWVFFISYVRLWCLYENTLLNTRAEMPRESAPAAVVALGKAWPSQQVYEQKGS